MLPTITDLEAQIEHNRCEIKECEDVCCWHEAQAIEEENQGLQAQIDLLRALPQEAGA